MYFISNLARFLTIRDIGTDTEWPVYVNFIFIQLHEEYDQYE